MRRYKNEIDDRIKDFVIQTIKTTRRLPKNPEYEVIKYQLIKSSSSVGANYREAQSSSTRNDFSYKVSLSLKEMAETSYWLELLQSVIINGNDSFTMVNELLRESTQLEKILATIRNKTQNSSTRS